MRKKHSHPTGEGIFDLVEFRGRVLDPCHVLQLVFAAICLALIGFVLWSAASLKQRTA